MIIDRAKMIARSYRQTDLPEDYLKSLIAVLSGYPDEVIHHVTDLRTGIQRSCKWPPAIAEIVTACEVHRDYLAKAERYRNFGKAAIEERKQLEAPREDRPTLEELQAKYGPNWGLTLTDPDPRPKFKAPDWARIAYLYQTDPNRLKRLVSTENESET